MYLGECERIWSCKGRVMALEEEPSVYRVWMPDQDCPGLAMSRAFGDFCLKDYGLIAVPEVFYRKLTEKDEFMVLASDGVSIIRFIIDISRKVKGCLQSLLCSNEYLQLKYVESPE